MNSSKKPANSTASTTSKPDITQTLESKASFQALEKFNSEVLKTAVDNAEVDIPQVMIDDKIDQMIEELAMKLETQRMSLDDYLKYAEP